MALPGKVGLCIEKGTTILRNRFEWRGVNCEAYLPSAVPARDPLREVSLTVRLRRVEIITRRGNCSFRMWLANAQFAWCATLNDPQLSKSYGGY